MRVGLLVAACGLLGLVGCGGGTPVVSSVTQPIAPLSDVALSGVVSSGTQPIVGAHVYLLAANTTGYGGNGIAAASGNASVSVVSAAETGTSDSVGAYVVTDALGLFNLKGDYACSSGQQLYIYTLGGTTGSQPTPSAGLMAAIGSCPGSSGSAVFATVNEVSTVAAAYALAGFATDATHVSSSGTALAQVGVANAFANAGNLATLATGVALATTPAGNGTVPQAEINTLADVLASCVTASASCGTLLATATADGTATGTKAIDTATAAINIAHHPGANVAALYGMASGVTSFAPGLTRQPSDFTVGLVLSGGGLYVPQKIAIDGAGNAWVMNEDPSTTVVELSNLGTLLSGGTGFTGGFNNASGVAIDRSGNAWIADTNESSVVEISGSGTILSPGNGYSVGGVAGPGAIAIDGAGNLWTTNQNSSVSELSPSGTAISGSSGYIGGGLNVVVTLAISGNGSIWVVDESSNSVTEMSSTGSFLSGASGITGGGMSDPRDIAIDGAGNVWVVNSTSSSITEFSGSGAVLSGVSGYVGGGLNHPLSIAFDGSGNAWIANFFGASFVELSNSGSILSGASGYFVSHLSPNAIAVDGSGDVWGLIPDVPGNVAELIGAGTPVVTPLAVGVKNNVLGTRP